MRNIYIFNIVLLLIINFKINNIHGAVLNSPDVENQVQRTIRQVVQDCKTPTIPNGSVNILKQNSSPKIKSLFISVACESNFILQPEEDNLFCVNGFWDVDEIPECKKCEKRSYTTVIDENKDSQLICPESFNDNNIFIDCGQRKYGSHQPFIVNGTKSKFGEFPWHVAIYKKVQTDVNPVYQCGGSIITEKNILTVAHCFADGYGNIIPKREYFASAGKFHRNYYSDSVTTQNRKVVKLDLHPRYKGEYSNYAWDIAVITLDEPFKISSIVLPVCVDWKNLYENEHLSSNSYGEVAGWGKTEANMNDAALELRVLKVPFIGFQQCNKNVPNTFLKYITHDKFCAGWMNGSSVCDGDSGGGLVFERQEKGKIKYYIRGLVSLGIQKDSFCDSFKYSTYTKISEYVSFIREIIQSRNLTTAEATDRPSTTHLPENIENSTEAIIHCKTPNEEEAKCISLYDCKIFVDALQKSPTPDTIKFINESQCGTLDERKVCCGSVTYYRKCIPPTVKNGQVKTIRQVLNQEVNVLLANVVCDDNYVLQFSQYVILCSNGNWDYETIPKCKRCVRSDELADIDANPESLLVCPDSINDHNCGQRYYETNQPFVVNRGISKFAEFPWHVAIYKKDENDSLPKYQCAGSIINKQSILTVAHCFSDDYGNIIKSREYYISAGKFHRDYNSDRETTQNRKVVKIDLHPRYKGELTNYAWDIAVVTVDEPFNTTTIVHPVCIDWETKFENEHLSLNKYGEIAGWGNTDAALQLRTLKVPFINIDECVQHASINNIKYLTHDKFCAGSLKCSSVCDADNGAGLIFERKEGGKTKYYIRGLLSVGFQKNETCDFNTYSAYTKVSDYISFIRKSIQNVTTMPSATTDLLLKSPEDSTEPIVSCKTPNNEEAKCVSLYDCKIFVYALQKFPTPDVIKFIRDSQCGKLNERKVCCGLTFKDISVIHSNPVTSRPFEHSNLHLLPKAGVCGRRAQVRENRMYGETVAKLLDFPWMALLDYGAHRYNDFCAGFLINERYLLTLATCVRINTVRVRLGEYDLNTNIDCVNITRGTGLLPNGRKCSDPPVDVDIEDVIIHPLFDNRTKINDIALLRLAKKVSYTDFIRPICLPLNGEISLPGKQMIASKWESEKKVKLKYYISAITSEECMKEYDIDLQLAKTLGSYVCAGYEEPKKKCIGDFGSPLMTTFSNSNYIYAEGIVAFSAGRCGEFPIIATKLTLFINWILDTLKP